MSRFIRSGADKSKNRVSGFTPAELEAAEWSRNFFEAEKRTALPTHGDRRGRTDVGICRRKTRRGTGVGGQQPARQEREHQEETGQSVQREARAWSLESSSSPGKLGGERSVLTDAHRSCTLGRSDKKKKEKKKKKKQQKRSVDEKRAENRNQKVAKEKKDNGETARETCEGKYEVVASVDECTPQGGQSTSKPAEMPVQALDEEGPVNTSYLGWGAMSTQDMIEHLLSSVQWPAASAAETQVPGIAKNPPYDPISIPSRAKSRSSSSSSARACSETALPEQPPKDPRNPLLSAHELDAYEANKREAAKRQESPRRNRSSSLKRRSHRSRSHQREHSKRHMNQSSRRRKNGDSRSSASDRNRRGRRSRSLRRRSRRPSRSLTGAQAPTWDHKPFLERSPSPCRERTEGAMYNTRKDAWRSRAGGVYIPPQRAKSESSAREPQARYLHPEEFARYRLGRRSPSPVYELNAPRER